MDSIDPFPMKLDGSYSYLRHPSSYHPSTTVGMRLTGRLERPTHMYVKEYRQYSR